MGVDTRTTLTRIDKMSLDSGAATRTYNPNVRVGNWNEEICLEDDMLKDFLEKQEAGTLLIQRTQSLMQTLLQKTELKEDCDVTVGDNVMLINPGRSGLVTDGDKQMQNLPQKLQSVAANRKISGVAPLQLVSYELDEIIPYGAFWTVECFDPLLRMEHEGLPVPKNSPILLKHCSTGQHLAVLDDSSFRTPFGSEQSVGAKTYFNSHKVEQDNNYWLFK